jgi:ABC-type multidrug transport system ATPase subunit
MIAAEAVYKALGCRPVLNGLTLELVPGEIYGLLGQNGAGKSTAINVLSGLLPPDSGHVLLRSRPLSRASRRRLGVAPQEPALYPRLTSRENLAFFAALYDPSPSTVRRLVAAAADRWGLESYIDTRVERLSGGWRRRVSLAVAMVHGPEVLLLDEPTVGLDAATRLTLWEVIRGLARRGAAVLLSTHLFDEAEALCDRVGIMHAGRIVREGSLTSLRAALGAAAVAELEVTRSAELEARFRELGWRARSLGEGYVVLLPRPVTMVEVLDALDGADVHALRLREPALEDVFRETVGAAGSG